MVYRRNVPGKPKRWLGPYYVNKVVGKAVEVIVPPQVKDRGGPPTMATFAMDSVKRFVPDLALTTSPSPPGTDIAHDQGQQHFLDENEDENVYLTDGAPSAQPNGAVLEIPMVASHADGGDDVF